MNIRIPVSWLRDYLKTDVAAKTITQLLTASGPSVERIEKHGEDLLLDIEVTTNRPDAFSIYGLAREAHAILLSNKQKSRLEPPKGLETNLKPDTAKQLPLDVTIRGKNLCERFTAVVIDNVKIKPSPAQIRNRLEICGIRSINNIVDISNYVMLELGQPMHTFDYDKIKGSKMILRESVKGEKIKTIDGQVRKLEKGTIVIEDAERLIDLCGIMGGENSAVTSRTKRVVMFVQSYNPVRIRKTTQALSFTTDAAARFEKGIDLEGILPALARSIYLAKQTANAKIASELIDIYPHTQKTQPITLRLDKLNNYLGISVPKEKAQNILNSLGFKTTTTVQTITATPPSWRVQDVTIAEDLIEEIARIYGYQNLPAKLPQGEIPQSEDSVLEKVIELKKALKYLGLSEIISYSIISKELLTLAGISQKDALELANPLTEDWQFMRPSILPSLAKIIAQNQNTKSDIKLFEIAKTYLPPETSVKGGEPTSELPKQDLKLALALWPADFGDIKGTVENIFEVLKKEPQFLLPRHSGQSEVAGSYSLFDQQKSARIKVGDNFVGNLGILKREIAENLEVQGDVATAELNLSDIYLTPTIPLSFHPIPKYPPIIEDISAIFDQKTTVGEILTTVKRLGDPLVKQVDILDIYQDEKLGPGKKSITLRLTYQKPNETPSQEEVTRFRNIIVREIERIFKAHVRK